MDDYIEELSKLSLSERVKITRLIVESILIIDNQLSYKILKKDDRIDCFLS